MDKIAQRIAIAKSLGLEVVSDGICDYLTPSTTLKGGFTQIPDYLNDLNEMWDVEEVLFKSWKLGEYATYLPGEGSFLGAVHATAGEKAEAYLKTVGYWVEAVRTDR